MIWIFGFVTGMAFKMPLWWWVLGFFLVMADGSSRRS